jgi:MoaA/NifB/PqqE/SkfB family radical SAM enzyme
MATLKHGGQPVPKQIHFIISDLCNHDCHFCAYRMSGGFTTEQFAGEDKQGKPTHNPNRMIPKEKCIEILSDMKACGVRAVQFTGGGEPTVHPDHIDIFKHALDIGLECALVTNGSLLRDGWREILPSFKWIRISLDAGSPEEYAEVRRIKPTAYHRTLYNIGRLSDEIKTQNTDCLFGVGYVVTRENFRGLRRGLMEAKEAGARYVRVAAMFSEEGADYYRDIYSNIQFDIEWGKKQLQDDSFKVVDLFGVRMEDLRLQSPDYHFCGYQFMTMYIAGNQKIYRCCTTSYTEHGEVGDLTNQRLRDWFDSEEKKKAYTGFDATTCKVCQFNNQNKTINYIIGDEPLHVNFV